MRAVPLNPCDYLYFAQHDLMQRRGLLGNPILMVLDVRGRVDPARLDAALRRTLLLHPVLNARLRIARLTGRPYWRLDDESARPSLRVHPPANESRFDAFAQDCFVKPLDVTASPQVHVDLLPGEDDRSRLCFTWPHALMDAEGGQWFVHELDRMDRAPQSKRPAALSDDGAPHDPLARVGWLQRIALTRRGWRQYRSDSKPFIALADGPTHGAHWRFVHHHWPVQTHQEIRDRALFWCPTGSARFGRYLAGCVLRALHRLYLERGLNAESLLITMPMRLRTLPAVRPLTGNHLVSATLVGRRAVLDDKRALMDALTAQVDAFNRNDNDLANWALIRLAGWQRAWQYRRTLGSPRRGFQPYASGFSFYGEIDPPLRRFLDTDVLNFWGTTTMPVPPGWNPAFARFGDSLNFILSWLDGYISHKTAARYAELIEAELLDSQP